jgi:peptidoglycan/xylan/chitin deacetylase (PgdA/CDA1 family)
MILNGHVGCTNNLPFLWFFRKMCESANHKNNQVYSRSLARHVWTFDDGLTDQLELFLKYFQAEGLVFQFFVCPKLVDEWEVGNIEYVRRQLNNPRAELLSWDEIGRLAESGNIIGSHGVDHTSFSSMSIEQSVEQLERSMDLIKQRTGYVPTSFAFPYGAVSPSSLAASLMARKWYREVYLSDNSIAIGEIANGVFNRRHSEFGVCAARGILIGALNILFGINKWRS